jgi:hypothetical protein
MPKKLREIIRQTFKGHRFEDHGLELTVLPELVAYRALVVEVARHLWRRNNPKRERLPSNFEDSFVLKFFELESGSTCVPILREVDQPEQKEMFEEPDEFDLAVRLTNATIFATDTDAALPPTFPAGCLSMFEDYGKTLGEDECIEYSLADDMPRATYSPEIRRRLLSRSQGAYEDVIDISGTVTMARVNRPRMALTLDEGHDIEGAFRPEDEERITTALKEHKSVRLRVRGRGLFSPAGDLRKILEVQDTSLVYGDAPAFVEGKAPIWRVFEEIVQGVPKEQLDALPIDGASNHDDYVYGAPDQQ